MPAQKSYTMDAFHIPFNGDSICKKDEVLSEKLPPDKVKVLLTTAAYLVPIIMCILIPATSYNGVPAVLRTSSVGVIPEEMSTCDTFHSYTMSSTSHHQFSFKPWTNALDLKYTTTRPFLTQMITPAKVVQDVPTDLLNESSRSFIMQQTSPDMITNIYNEFSINISINIPTINYITLYYNFEIFKELGITSHMINIKYGLDMITNIYNEFIINISIIIPFTTITALCYDFEISNELGITSDMINIKYGLNRKLIFGEYFNSVTCVMDMIDDKHVESIFGFIPFINFKINLYFMN